MNKIISACKKRRAELIKNLAPNSLIILAGSYEAQRNSDVHYPFRQNSDFYYLTGFVEPNAVALLSNNKNLPEFTLFVNPKDPASETWTGIRAGTEGAQQTFGADSAYSISDLDKILTEYMAHSQNYYYSFGINHKFDNKFLKLHNNIRAMQRTGVNMPDSIIPLENLLNSMRVIKDDVEIELMTHAARVSAEAHIIAMRNAKDLKYEYQVYSLIMQHFLANNMVEAYGSIVGCGKNSCILHYTQNNAELHSNELLLIDAGGEYYNYGADITRTFPVGGKFSPEQKEIYNIVLAAQKEAIKEIKPGNSWNAAQEKIVKIITDGLMQLKIINNPEDYKNFYMHKSGHWLGLDVHDVGAYKTDNNWIKLQENMVLTVEPGIYIAPNKDIDKKWWNIGVRIEDDILVTKNGHKNLTEIAPKEIADIEKIINE